MAAAGSRSCVRRHRLKFSVSVLCDDGLKLIERC